MSATVVFAKPTSSCSETAAAAIRARVASWASARAFSSYLRCFWVDTVFSDVTMPHVRCTPRSPKGSQMQSHTAPKIVGPSDGKAGTLGSIGVRVMIDAEATHAGGFSLVEHPMPPHALAAPLHRHSREDEYSYVLEGRMGALLGDEVVYGEPGDLIFKPRNQWHTFWNAGDEPARLLEIISPGGFEAYFERVSALLAAGPPDPAAIGAIAADYDLDIDPDSIPR